MRIGILTYHTPCNFGANLQAYASYKYFTSLGIDTWIINYSLVSDNSYDISVEAQKEAHWNFSQDVLRVTRVVNSESLHDLVREMNFDAIGVGADAIWNKRIVDDLRVFFCDWIFKSDLKERVKVFALSPAFMGQTYSDLPLDVKKDFKSALEQFTYLNARDQWTAHIVNKEIVGYELIKNINPDPVFMLDKFVDVEWKHPDSVHSKKYYLISLPKDYTKSMCVLKRIWVKRLISLLHRKGYQLVEIPTPDGTSGIDSDYIVPYPIDPLQWYLWIKNAKGYIGIRFHAIVSSLSAGTPFLSLDTYGKVNSKIHKLFCYLGFHKNDHNLNRSSKIRNLIDGSGLERCRINGTFVFMVSPRRIINLIEGVDLKLMRKFREKNIEKFEYNMGEMIKKVHVL